MGVAQPKQKWILRCVSETDGKVCKYPANVQKLCQGPCLDQKFWIIWNSLFFFIKSCLRLETSLDFVILKLTSLLSHGCHWHRTAQIPLLVRKAHRISTENVSCITGKAIESLKSSAGGSAPFQLSFHCPKVGNSSLFNKAFSMCHWHEAGACAVPKGRCGFWGALLSLGTFCKHVKPSPSIQAEKIKLPMTFLEVEGVSCILG